MNKARTVTGIAIIASAAIAAAPIPMPLVTALRDKALPQLTVMKAALSGGDVIQAYGSYWRGFAARPDALVCLGIYMGLLALACAAAWAYSRAQNPSRRSESGVLGDASIIKSQAAIRHRNDFWNGKGRPDSAGLVLGASRSGYIYDSSVPHAAVVGKTGSGKSQFMVLETLHLLLAAGWNIIATGKNELVELTGDKAVELGCRLLILDLNGYPGAGSFNPIALVTYYADRGKPSQAMQTARQVAADLVPVTGTANDFFPKAARSCLTAIILMVAMADIPAEQKNMESVAAIVNRGTTGAGKDPSAPLKDHIRSLGEGSPVYSCASEFLSDGGTTVAGKNVLSTLKDALSIFSDEAVAQATHRSDADLHSLIEERCIVYVHLLEENHPYQAIFACFFNQYWRVANEIANANGGRLPHETAIVGDELGNCNKILSLPEMTTLGRSMRFHVYAFVQNLGQLRRYNQANDHDAGMNKLLGSMGIKVALSLGAAEDFSYFTRLVGKRTVRTQGTSSTSRGRSGGSSSGTSYNETADDVIHEWEWQQRIPSRDGSIVVKGGENSKPGREGVFQMPLTYASRTPAGAFFGLGSIDEELAKRRAFRDRMASEAKGEAGRPLPWCPDFSQLKSDATSAAEVCEDEFAVWDELMQP